MKRDLSVDLVELFDNMLTTKPEDVDGIRDDKVVAVRDFLEAALARVNQRIETNPLDSKLESLLEKVREILCIEEEDLASEVMRKLFRTLKITEAFENYNKETGEIEFLVKWSIHDLTFTFMAELVESNGTMNGVIELLPFISSMVDNVTEDMPFAFISLDNELQPICEALAIACNLKELDANAWIVVVKLLGNALVVEMQDRAEELFGKPLAETKVAEKIVLALKEVVEAYEPGIEDEEEDEDEDAEEEEGEEEEEESA